MSTAAKALLTEAEYLATEGQALTKSDFYAGEMIATAGARRNHNFIVSLVASELREPLCGRPCEVYPLKLAVVSEKIKFPEPIRKPGPSR